jgi:hypothetical protein
LEEVLPRVEGIGFISLIVEMAGERGIFTPHFSNAYRPYIPKNNIIVLTKPLLVTNNPPRLEKQ